MKCLIARHYAILLLLSVMLSACSGANQQASSSNSNSSPAQANSNAATQPNVAQNSTPAPAINPPPPPVQQIPPPAQTNKSAPSTNANVAQPAASSNPRAPKLVLSEKKIDYGKQEQGKTLVRAIAIKNGGRSDLSIESVVPS